MLGQHGEPHQLIALRLLMLCGSVLPLPALQAFFKARPRLQGRPLAIAGESYGGKYVPSLGHFILSQAAALGGARSLGRLGPARNRAAKLATLQRRPLPPHLHLAERPLLREPPLFELRGLAIGNGLTDPAAQVTGRVVDRSGSISAQGGRRPCWRRMRRGRSSGVAPSWMPQPRQ